MMVITLVALLALTERAAALRPHVMSRRAAVGAAFSAAALPLAPVRAMTTVEDGLAEDKLGQEFEALEAIDERLKFMRAPAYRSTATTQASDGVCLALLEEFDSLEAVDDRLNFMRAPARRQASDKFANAALAGTLTLSGL